ncbi:MAG TPA: dipeptidase [Terriglobales bacterium]|nr:dipeptidase [Terriglobales bacterium]
MLPIKTYLLLTVFMACALASAQTKTSRKPNARAIHDSAIVIDTHADTPGRFVDENFDLATDTPVTQGHFDFGKVQQGNLGAEFFSIWVSPQIKTGYAKRALDMIDSVYEQARLHPDKMVMAYSAEDIVKARTGPHKRLASLMGVEGGHAIENDIRILRNFYRLGVRYMTLTWANTNEWADSSGDLDKPEVQHHNGLTDFGREVVREMNRLGMMVDVSHVSDKTFWDVIETTKAPVIASHSSARALNSHLRNMTDDMLRAVAKNNGVVMVNFYSGFIDEDYRKAYEAQKPEREKAVQEMKDHLRAQGQDPDKVGQFDVEKEMAARIPRPPFDSLINQIDHVAKVAGIDHVGLGSDFDGITSLPQGIDSVADLPKITEALVERGYTEEQIKKILGGNLLRVFREVEKVAKESKSL